MSVDLALELGLELGLELELAFLLFLMTVVLSTKLVPGVLMVLSPRLLLEGKAEAVSPNLLPILITFSGPI